MNDARRKIRLSELIERINAGTDVAARDMKLVLLDEQYSAFQSEWASQLEQRSYLRDKPAVVVEYEERLKAAQFAYSRAEGYSGSTKRKPVKGRDGLFTHQRFYRKAESLFGGLMEYLTEQLEIDPSLQIWFDRQVEDFYVGLSPDAMPRVVTSRSTDRTGAAGIAGTLVSKRNLKLDFLVMALEAILEKERLAGRTPTEIAAEEAQDAEMLRQRQELLRFFRRR